MTETLTAPSEHHHVKFTIERFGVGATAYCTAAEGSLCRLTCSKCDEECHCDNGPTEDYGKCIRAEWVNESGVVDCYDGPADAPLRDGEVAFLWDGDNYTWRYLNQVVTDHAFTDRTDVTGYSLCRYASGPGLFGIVSYCNLPAEWHVQAAPAAGEEESHEVPR